MRSFLALLVPATLAAQVPTPPDLARERAAFATWLGTDARSPYAVLALQPIGRGLSLGPAPSDVELDGIGRATLTEANGIVRLGGAATTAAARPLARYRALPFGPYRLAIDGPPGRAVAIVYGAIRPAPAPLYYVYQPDLVAEGVLIPPAHRSSQRLLALDGIEALAEDAGMFLSRIGRDSIRLTVYRFPDPATEEAELIIYFRDATSERGGGGSYPAGRFVALEPLGGGGYRLDFNRARNPLCAYSSVYPCPLPWPGNTLAMPIAAGERYTPPAPARP